MTLDALAGVPPSPGRMNVDFEERVDFTRLRAYRLSRARAALDASELGAVLLFDINNIRYVSATMIGEWARDKVARYALLRLVAVSRSSGISDPRRGTISSIRPGSGRRTAAPGCWACVARSRPTPA